MFGNRFNVAKSETTCRLCLGRIKLQRNKKVLQIKQYRREIADLLRTEKQEYARIRVEGVIRENLLLKAYEILELYLELLTVRAQLISKTKEIPRDMIEAISSIIYAAQRISDIPELGQLRVLFAAKYGKEYVAEATADATASKWQVNHNLIKCLLVEPPQAEEKLEMLSDIAQEHGVEWDLSKAARDLLPPIPATPLSTMSTGSLTNSLAAAAPVHALAPPPGFMAAPTQPMSANTHEVQWVNAQHAAQAAAQAATQARAAADYAAHCAASGHGQPAAQPQHPAMAAPGKHDRYATEYASQLGNSNGAPLPQGWLLQQTPGAGMPSTSSAPGSEGGSLFSTSSSLSFAPPSAGNPAAPGSSEGPSAGTYAVKTMEEIQRAYDAALGPPSKGEEHAAPPSAPPPRLPSPPPSAGLDLPHPPTTQMAGAHPPPPPKVEDEYEELTRRLEALKKS